MPEHPISADRHPAGEGCWAHVIVDATGEPAALDAKTLNIVQDALPQGSGIEWLWIQPGPPSGIPSPRECPECYGNGFPADSPDRVCRMCFGVGYVRLARHA